MMLLSVNVICALVLLFVLAVALWSMLAVPGISPRKVRKRARKSPTYLMIVLGSGGHTAEMMQLIRNLDPESYTFRRYVVSTGDQMSADRALEFESALAKKASAQRKAYGSFDIHQVTRARNIHQSLATTPVTASKCAWNCFKLLCEAPKGLRAQSGEHGRFPDLILTNGPATATIMIFVSILIRMIRFPDSAASMRCIYVESWARVKRLSLSGRILRSTRVCDRFLVQWQTLAANGGEFRGQLVA